MMSSEGHGNVLAAHDMPGFVAHDLSGSLPFIPGITTSVSRRSIGSPYPCARTIPAAVYLGMSKDWIYERLKTLVPHVKIGGTLKFRREDLDRYIASQTVAPMNIRNVKSPAILREVMREGAIPFLVEIDEAPMVGYADFVSWFDTKFRSTWSA